MIKKLELRKTLLTIALLSICKLVSAQYHLIQPFSIGLRGNPDGGGLTARFHAYDNLFVEGQANLSGGTQNGSGRSTMGALLIAGNLCYGEQIRVFLGVGTTFGVWQRYSHVDKLERYNGYCLYAGIDYAISGLPITVGLDARPSYVVANSGPVTLPNNTIGLNIRYYFGDWKIIGKTKKTEK